MVVMVAMVVMVLVEDGDYDGTMKTMYDDSDDEITEDYSDI
jgi:hypothetical protein